MRKIITPDGQAFAVSLEWTDGGSLRLVITQHPRSAGWTARALRLAAEISVERTRTSTPLPEKLVRKAKDFKVSRRCRAADGCVFVTIPDFTSLPFQAIAIPKNN